MPIASLLPLLVSILGQAPAVVASVQEIWTLAMATSTPTTDEQAAFDAALDAAHTTLQAS